MEHGWHKGMEKRMNEKRFKDGAGKGHTNSQTLPDIRSPSSPSNGQLVNSASEPMLSGSQGFDNTSRSQKTAIRSNVRLGPRAQRFLERQFEHSSVHARKSMAQLQRQIVSDSRSADEGEFLGAKGVAGFRAYLEKRYGSIIAGWRVLDADKSGRLSFYEFCNACRHMGYHGNLKKLWGELDNKQEGSVSLMQIDPEVGMYIGKFKLALMKKYGNILKAWKQGLDTNGTGRIEEKEVDAAVAKLGLDLDPKKLFRMLVNGPAGLGLTLAEFDPDAYNRWVSGDTEGIMSGGDHEFIEDLPGIRLSIIDDAKHDTTGASKKWRQKLAERTRGEVQAAVYENTKFRLGLHTVEGFKAALINRCGSLFGAWREALDLDGNGRLTFGEFNLALQRLAFHGNVLGLWKELVEQREQNNENETKVGTSSYLYFKDLDKPTDDAINELREKCEKTHSNMLLAWLQAFDKQGSGIVNEAQFVKACETLGLSGTDSNDVAAKAKHLFKVMQPDASRKFLTLQDFDTKAFLALSRGDFRMISETETRDKKPMDMTFDERQKEGFYYKIRRAWEAARREEFAKATKQAVPPHVIDTVEEFNNLCRRKYGSMIAAWRSCLDWDQNGRLTFNEFCKACRRLGYAGDLKALWAQYDSDKKGWIALKDLDREADQLVGEFLMMLAARFGTLDAAWKDGFNKDPHDSIDVDQLTEACKALGYPHDAGRLFKCLAPQPGRQLITIWDLDPLCTRKKQRGDVAYLSEPKNPQTKIGHSPHFNLAHELEAGESVDGGPSIMTTTGNLSNANMTNTSFRSATPSCGPRTLGLQGVTQQEQLRSSMKQKHGSTLAAWRRALDPRMSGGVSFGKFCIVLEDMTFHGNKKAMWQELCRDGEATCTFKDIDEEAQRTVDSLRQQLVDKYGSLVAAWSKGLDPEGQGCLDELEFAAAFEQMGLPVKNPKRIFRMLLSHPGSRSVKLDDLEGLLVGVKPEDRTGFWAGNKEAGAGTAAPASPSHRQLAESARLASQAQDKVIATIADFKRMLVTKYGSLFAGWRHGLDFDQNGVVTQRDFAQACNHLGVKAVQKLWAELDANRNGQISMVELDKETGAAFGLFEELIIEKYGNCKAGWKQCFDVKKGVACDKKTFLNACKVLGYPGDAAVVDAERLFKLLKPEPGRPHLTYEDIWLNLNPNEFTHVDEAVIHRSPASPKSKKRSSKEPLLSADDARDASAEDDARDAAAADDAHHASGTDNFHDEAAEDITRSPMEAVGHDLGIGFELVPGEPLPVQVCKGDTVGTAKLRIAESPTIATRGSSSGMKLLHSGIEIHDSELLDSFAGEQVQVVLGNLDLLDAGSSAAP